jgi:hypothetical protein
MKMHVLTAAVVAVLASQAGWAASEGGDTWSEVQPVQQSAYSVLQSTPAVVSADPGLQAAFEGSEGGDTWSSVQALRDAGDQDTLQASRGNMDYAGLPGGSEGGDTCSSVAPALESAPTSATGLAAATTHE